MLKENTKKFTYKEIGPDSWYQYELSDRNIPKIMVTSDTLNTLNVVEGSDNGIKRMITDVDNIGENITELESECFKGCPNLTSINLPTSLQIIGNETFKDCYKLSSFKDDVFNMPMYMGDSVFENCDFGCFTLKNNKNKTELENEENTDDIIIGKNMFSNNKLLSHITMDNVIFGENMFQNCNSLTSITISDTAEILYSGASPFNNCKNLTSLTIPNVDSYFELHSNFLKGSSILTFNLPNMSYEDVEVAIGVKSKNQVIPIVDNHVGYGDIFYYDTHNLDNVLIESFNKHIPLIIIECYMECSICTKFRKNILENYDFVNWFKNEFGKCSIVYCNDGGGRYRLPPSTPPNKSQEFLYTTRSGEIKKYDIKNINGIYLGGTDSLSLTNGMKFKKIHIIEERGKLRIYNIKDEYKSTIRKDLDLLNMSYYYDATQEYETPLMKFFSTGWGGKYYPVFSSYYRDNNDITKSTNVKKLTDEQKTKFLNGEDWSIEYYSYVSVDNPEKNTNKKIKYTIYFTATQITDSQFYSTHRFIQSKDYHIFLINDKIVIYEIIVHRNDSKISLGKIQQCKLCFNCDNIYLLCPNFDDDLYNSKKMILSNVENAKIAIENFYNSFFGNNLITPEITQTDIKTEKIYGDCWGVEHDCDVIDKDGKVHHYKYNPPKT